MKKNYTLKLVLAMLIVVLVSLVSFVGVYKGKNLLKDYTLGKDFRQRKVATFSVVEEESTTTSEENTTDETTENQTEESTESTTDEVVEDGKKQAISFMDLQSGDNIIITGGFPNTGVKVTNFMKIEEI